MTYLPFALAHLDQMTGVTDRTPQDARRMFETYIRPYWAPAGSP